MWMGIVVDDVSYQKSKIQHGMNDISSLFTIHNAREGLSIQGDVIVTRL